MKIFIFCVDVGEFVQEDEVVVVVETDKVNVDIRTTHAGVITKYFANEGDTVSVGADFFEVDPEGKPTASAAPPKKEPEVKQVRILLVIFFRNRLLLRKLQLKNKNQLQVKLYHNSKRRSHRLHQLQQSPSSRREQKRLQVLEVQELRLEWQ